MKTDLVNFFEVEELEQRLEYDWSLSTTCSNTNGVTTVSGTCTYTF